MNITGLQADLYYINNPIWVNITDLDTQARYVDVIIVDVTDPANEIVYKPLRLYPYKQKLDYNFDEVAKAHFMPPMHPKDADLGNGDRIPTSYRRFRITFLERLFGGQGGETIGRPNRGGRLRGDPAIDTTYTYVGDGDQLSYTKTFLRGGFRRQTFNHTASVGDVLKQSDRIPRWGGYPIRKYYIDEGKHVVQTRTLSLNEIDDRPIIGCDPLYVRFLNSKGGYSFWLFESWECETKYKSHGVIKRRAEVNSQHFGFTTQDYIEAETRLPKEYQDLMHGLLRSPEVDIYNLFDQTWCRVVVADNNFVTNNYDTVQKVKVDFKVYLNEFPSTIW